MLRYVLPTADNVEQQHLPVNTADGFIIAHDSFLK